MAYDNKEAPNYIDTTFFESNGIKTFMKAKSDWINIGKIHLSFVSHGGKSTGCKQVASIEAALDIVKDNGIIVLAQYVLSGAALRDRNKSYELAAANGSTYPTSIWESTGGTAKSAKDGKCYYRKIALAPGMVKKQGKPNDYALNATQCEGELGSDGGIMPKKGAVQTFISVPFTKEALVCFSRLCLIEWEAHRSSKLVTDFLSAKQNIPKVPVETSIENKVLPIRVAFVYDESGNVPITGLRIEKLLDFVKDVTTNFAVADPKMVANKNDFAGFMKELESRKPFVCDISYNAKNDAEIKNSLSIIVLDV